MERRTTVSILAGVAAIAGIALASTQDSGIELTKAVPQLASVAGWSGSWTTPAATTVTASATTEEPTVVPAAIDPCLESQHGLNIRVAMENGKAVLTRNKNPWKMRSIQFRGFTASLATAGFLETHSPGDGARTIDAQNIYGAAELDAAWQQFGANTVRFLVSQHDLDPQSPRNRPEGQMPAYDPAYRDKVLAAIQLAREKCFVVMIAMQAQKWSGVIKRKNFAYKSTRRAWNTLLSGPGAFITTDKGIMLEPYNEPGGKEQPLTLAEWRLWAHASENSPDYENGSTPEDQIYGMQPMINFLRGAPYNSQNVIIVNGLRLADTYENVDLLANPVRDPLKIAGVDQLAYAVHPYFRTRMGDGPADWQKRFGFLLNAGANGRPPVMVMSNEWSAGQHSTATGLAIGTANPPGWQVAVDLLNWLRNKGIPSGAAAMDIPGVMSLNPLPSNLVWTPTNYDNWDSGKCPQSRNNAGLLISVLFKTNYSTPLVKADGLSSNPANSPIYCSN